MTESVIRPEMFKLPGLTREVVIFFNLGYFKLFHKRVNGSKIKNFGPARRFQWEGRSSKITALGGMIGAPLAALIVELAMASGAKVIYSYGSAGSVGDETNSIGDLVVPEIGFDETGICNDYSDKRPHQVFSPCFSVQTCRAITSVNSFFRLTRQNIRRYRESDIQLIDMEAAPLHSITTLQGNSFHPLFVVSDRVSPSFEWENGSDRKTFKQGLESGMEMIAQL